MSDDLIEAWRTNQRINLHLIEHISPAGLRCTLSKRGGRDVARQFAHMHDVRVWQLEKRAKDLADGLEAFETKVTPTKKQLLKALKASGKAVESFLVDVRAAVPRRRGMKRGLATTLSYFVAHESHHRGSILLTLKESGHAIPQKERYAIWGWDQI